jgi:hypothetical protein
VSGADMFTLRLLRAIQIEGQRLLRCACCKPMP